MPVKLQSLRPSYREQSQELQLWLCQQCWGQQLQHLVVLHRLPFPFEASDGMGLAGDGEVLSWLSGGFVPVGKWSTLLAFAVVAAPAPGLLLPWWLARRVGGMITTSTCRWRTGLMRGLCFMEERLGDTAKDEKLLQEGLRARASPAERLHCVLW